MTQSAEPESELTDDQFYVLAVIGDDKATSFATAARRLSVFGLDRRDVRVTLTELHRMDLLIVSAFTLRITEAGLEELRRERGQRMAAIVEEMKREEEEHDGEL